jgi:hypothetical protein
MQTAKSGGSASMSSGGQRIPGGVRARTARARSGRASVLFFVALLAVLGVALTLVVTLRGGAPHDGPPQLPAPAPAPGSGPEEPPSLAPRYQIGQDRPSAPLDRRPPLEERPSFPAEQRFSGSGRIEGRLALPEGVAAPARWTLVLEPSRALIGGDSARGRRVEFSAGELEFSLADVPLGGYEIYAEAPRMSGRHEHFFLARPDSTQLYQDLVLRPAAFVEGRVTDVHGSPVEGLPIHLTALGAGTTYSAICDAGGHYLFDAVADGEYRLEVGHRDAPLAPARELSVLPPSLHMPDLSVPELFDLDVLVLDREGRPLEGALVRGWGSAGGRVEVASDVNGRARARYLPAGRVTLDASVPDSPEAGHARLRLELPAAHGGPIELRLER